MKKWLGCLVCCWAVSVYALDWGVDKSFVLAQRAYISGEAKYPYLIEPILQGKPVWRLVLYSEGVDAAGNYTRYGALALRRNKQGRVWADPFQEEPLHAVAEDVNAEGLAQKFVQELLGGVRVKAKDPAWLAIREQLIRLASEP